MEWLVLAGQLFKLIFFFLDLWKEKDKVKAEKKAKLGEELVGAFAETDRDTRASRINVTIGRIDRLKN